MEKGRSANDKHLALQEIRLCQKSLYIRGGKLSGHSYFHSLPHIRLLFKPRSDKIKKMNFSKKKKSERFSFLPQNYRKIAARLFKWPFFASFIFLFFFFASLFSPPAAWEKEKLLILKDPLCFSAHLKLAQHFLQQHQFSLVQKEIDFLEKNRSLLNNSERQQLSQIIRQYQHATPQNIEALIHGWQLFLKKYPQYKIGWFYLSLYQKQLNLPEAEKTKEEIKKIDPGLYESLF